MKKISNSDIIGDGGIALIHRVVNEMGCTWHPTRAPEAGIDGFIEFRDPATGVMLSKFVFVQSKATLTPFNSGSITYTCEPNDLAYWLSFKEGPIILVYSNPDTGEAYWKHLQGYFADPERRASRKVFFDRERDRFDKFAYDRLLRCATEGHPGFELPLHSGYEMVYSNLLTIRRLPKQLYFAKTRYSKPRAIWAALRAQGCGSVREWAHRGDRILSVHDLAEPPWREICDPGTVESFTPEEWWGLGDLDGRNDFIHLLKQCLRSRLAKDNVYYDRDEGCFYFAPNSSEIERQIRYRTRTGRDEPRTVISRYSKTLPDGSERVYYRHFAFEARFRVYEGTFYLQLDPTHWYSKDGRTPLPNSGNLKTGMRRMEKNEAMRNHLIFLEFYLQDPRIEDLFSSSEQDPYLGFGELLAFRSKVVVPDKEWLEVESEGELGDEQGTSSDEMLEFDF